MREYIRTLEQKIEEIEHRTPEDYFEVPKSCPYHSRYAFLFMAVASPFLIGGCVAIAFPFKESCPPEGKAYENYTITRLKERKCEDAEGHTAGMRSKPDERIYIMGIVLLSYGAALLVFGLLEPLFKMFVNKIYRTASFAQDRNTLFQLKEKLHQLKEAAPADDETPVVVFENPLR